MKSLTSVLLLLCLGPAAALADDLNPEAARLVAASRSALASGDAAQAITFAEQAVAAAPEHADPHAQLGHACGARIGQVNVLHQAALSIKMVQALERAVALDPDHVGARIGLARYYTFAPAIAGGSRKRAEAEAAELKARHAFLGAIEFGLIADHFGDATAAEAAFAEAVRIQPKDANARERLAALLERRGDTDGAREHLLVALRQDPDRASAQAALARLNP